VTNEAAWNRSMLRGRLYRDRTHAGECLAARLDAYRDTGALVLGIPRGGVPVAAEVTRLLEADLDVVVARKLRAPGFPELAIGAVTANGGQFLNEDVIRELAVSPDYLTEEIAVQMADARRREERFRGGHAPRDLIDRVVVVVDDGLATGATMRATVRSVRSGQPARLVVAVPVGSAQACAALRQEADELICLSSPEDFWAVGAYYLHFEPIEDDEVTRILHVAHQEAAVDTVGLDERRLRG
jgi:putative phosphoribosyl transferase